MRTDIMELTVALGIAGSILAVYAAWFAVLPTLGLLWLLGWLP